MPTQIVKGDRIGKMGRIRAGCSAVIFNDTGDKILLTRRSDIDLWCLPGGGIDPGESVAETCTREVFEETGLHGKVKRLIGVYSNPNWLVEYPDGNRAQLVALCFEFVPEPGTLMLNSEVSEFGYFTLAEIENLHLMIDHHQRILDAFAQKPEAFIR